jgi:hypothetical protein
VLIDLLVGPVPRPEGRCGRAVPADATPSCAGCQGPSRCEGNLV